MWGPPEYFSTAEINRAKTRFPNTLLLIPGYVLAAMEVNPILTPFTSVSVSTGALQRIDNAFSRFLQPFLPSEETWFMLPRVLRGRGCSGTQPQWLGSICLLLCRSHITCTYWASNMCHHCARCCRARDTGNRSGFADYVNTCASCKLTSLSAFTGALETFPIFPLFCEIATCPPIGERDLGLLVFCTSVVRGKALFLKICLKGNELIISNLKNCHQEFTAIRSYWGLWSHK